MTADAGLDAQLEDARSSLGEVHDNLSGFVMAPARLLPFVGRQLKSADALAESGSETIDVADSLVEVIEVAGPELRSGNGRVAALRSIEAAMADANTRLRALDLGPDQNLVSQLRDVRRRLADAVEEGVETTQTGAMVAGEVAALIEGPSRYVLGAANNAEMRAGSGLVLSAGELITANGALLVTEMTPAWDRNLEQGVVIPDEDLRDRWSWLTDGRDWLLNFMSPRFPATAEHAVAMWNAQADTPADGMVVVDPFALKAILELTGPVETSVGPVDASNVIDLFLNEQYQDTRIGTGDQVLRRDRLGDVAPNVVQKLFDTEIDAVQLFDQLRTVVEGRHLLVWSSDPETQRVWEEVGVAGALDENSVAVSLINRGPNKLDYFTNFRTEIAVDERTEDHVSISLTVTITNRTPMGQPRYVEGPVLGSDTPAGAYRGIVTFNVPSAAQNIRIDGVDDLTVAGPDGPTRVVGTEVLVLRGEAAVVVARLDLPVSVQTLQLEAGARYPVEAWVVDGDVRRNGLSAEIAVGDL